MIDDANDRNYMTLAIDHARRCQAEDDRARPLVGAVVVKDGKLVATAFRGELDRGEHAEYTALERKAAEVQLAGATVYTTLEPCTTRNAPKVACAERLIERRVARVVIGMLDPNPVISGKGQRRLRDANIRTDLFPPDLMAQVEELNRAFARAQNTQGAVRTVSAHDVAVGRDSSVLASVDDRVRTVSLASFEPKWQNFSETYWLIGPITIENRRDVPVSFDGHLDASHSQGPIRFNVEGTHFRYWDEAMRQTHQASAPQLIFPTQVTARNTVRGIAIIRFPASELGGMGRYHELGQKLTFVLTLIGEDCRWSVPLRLPFQWNPKPPVSLR